MKKIIYFCFLLLPFFSQAKEEIKSSSFYKGYILYQNHIASSEIFLDFDEVLEGLKEAHKKNTSFELQGEDLEKFQERYFKQVQVEKLAEANEFLKKIAVEEGVEELVKEKLYYKIIKAGSGPKIGENPILLCKVKTLCKGKEEECYQFPEAKSIRLSSTIDGFSKGINGMTEGEIRSIYIHPDLAYGAVTVKFAPNSLMIFEVEVVKADKES